MPGDDMDPRTDTSAPPSATLPTSHGLLAELERLQRTVREGRAADSVADPDALEQELETAYEELRVAGEELRVQEETIGRLVSSHEELRLQQERTIAILPVPVVVTDLRGTILSVNAAAAVLTGMRAARLLRKPVFLLFSDSDRGDLRRMLAARRGEGLVVRRTATLVPKVGEPVSVEVMASMQLPGTGNGEISWVLLTARDYPQATGPADLSEALMELATLPTGTDRLEDALPAAAAACRRALGGSVEVSLALGSPLDPTAVVSSSQVAQLWDGAQLALGEGPSVTAYDEARLVETGDAAADERWPALRTHLPEGDHTVVAAPITTGERVVGVITAYGAEGTAPVDAVEIVAVTLGGLVREFELMAELTRIEQDMRRALASRSLIDQAKGIIMADRGVDAEAAWQHLVHLSSTHHVKLREVAEAIVARACGD